VDDDLGFYRRGGNMRAFFSIHRVYCLQCETKISVSFLFQFLDPFKTDLWMMILAFIAVAGTALFLISRFDPTMQTATEQKFDLKDSAWYAINILLQVRLLLITLVLID
jgi:hypothetical protein